MTLMMILQLFSLLSCRWLLLLLLPCSYEVRSGRRIALVFEEARLGKVGAHRCHHICHSQLFCQLCAAGLRDAAGLALLLMAALL
jgi:hypothetical protein